MVLWKIIVQRYDNVEDSEKPPEPPVSPARSPATLTLDFSWASVSSLEKLEVEVMWGTSSLGQWLGTSRYIQTYRSFWFDPHSVLRKSKLVVYI